MARKKRYMMNTGKVENAEGRITAQRLSVRASLSRARKLDSMVTWKGMSIKIIYRVNSALRKGKSNRANPQAAGAPISSCPVRIPTVMAEEFQKAWKYSGVSKKSSTAGRRLGYSGSSLQLTKPGSPARIGPRCSRSSPASIRAPESKNATGLHTSRAISPSIRVTSIRKGFMALPPSKLHRFIPAPGSGAEGQ